MLRVPLVAQTNLPFELIVQTLALELVVPDVGILEVFIVKVVDLSLILLNKILHTME